jgi:ribosome-associated protein
MRERRDLRVGERIRIPGALLEIRRARSPGPGGQHVNKTETKIDLRVELASLAPYLGNAAVDRLRRLYPGRIDGADRMRVTCSRHRVRRRNLDEALARLEDLLATGIVEPRARKKTRPTRSSRRRRVDDKKKRGALKRSRRELPSD